MTSISKTYSNKVPHFSELVNTHPIFKCRRSSTWISIIPRQKRPHHCQINASYPVCLYSNDKKCVNWTAVMLCASRIGPFPPSPSADAGFWCPNWSSPMLPVSDISSRESKEVPGRSKTFFGMLKIVSSAYHSGIGCYQLRSSRHPRNHGVPELRASQPRNECFF